MSDLVRRSQEVRRHVADTSLPKWQRLTQAMQSWSGLQLTGLAENVRTQLEADLVAVERLSSRYPLQTFEDYQIINDVDLQTLLDMVDAAASRAIAAELDRIVAELDAGVHELPEQAIREAREHRDLMTPRLIAILREAASGARTGNVREGNAHFFALFLLTEFRADEALPAILEAFSLPGNLPLDLFEDAVTSTLPRALALFLADHPEVIDGMIDDQALNEYVRWVAAQCYVYWVRDGRLARDEAVRRLQGHLRKAIEREDRMIAGPLICAMDCLAPQEALGDIKEAFNRNLVDPLLVDFRSVEEGVEQGEDRVRRELAWCPPTGIDDTIVELRTWASFTEQPAIPSEAVRSAPPPPMRPTQSDAWTPMPKPPLTRGVKVGRNAPCPCGSGKKYKKCCGSGKQEPGP